MPTIAFPTRYRPRDPRSYVSPAVLTPPDDDTAPAFDPSAMQSRSLQDEPSLSPPPDDIPKPPRLNDTQAGASVENLPPLNPDAGPKASYAGLKNGAIMPPPGTALPEPPAAGPTAPPPAIPGAVPKTESATQLAPKPPSDLENAIKDNQGALAAKHAERPGAPTSNWAQRLGLAILSMTKLAPEANQIIHPKWSEQSAAYQGSLKDLEAQQKELDTSMSTQALASQRDANAEQKRGMAQDYSIKEDDRRAANEDRAKANLERIAAMTSARNQKFMADQLKGRESDASYQSDATPRPPGWDFLADPEKPGFGYSVPPAVRPAPPELLPYLPGIKAGDPISHQEFKTATTEANKANLERTKQDKPKGVATPFEAYMQANGGDPAKALAAQQRDEIARARESRQPQQSGINLTSDQKAIAEKLASGDFNPALLARYPDKEAITGAALAINPAWTNQTYATKKSFTDPAARQSQNLGTIARIVEHLGRFDDNSEKLGISPSMLTGTNLTGGASRVHADAHAIASEMEKLVSGGVGTQSQVDRIQGGLTSTRPDLRKAASEELSQLIGGQYIGMNQSYKAGTGQDLPQDQFVSEHGRAWLQKNGINVTGATAGAAGNPSDMINVQIPGQPPGQIHASQKDAFKQKYPNAVFK